jgi:hypothetical protein
LQERACGGRFEPRPAPTPAQLPTLRHAAAGEAEEQLGPIGIGGDALAGLQARVRGGLRADLLPEAELVEAGVARGPAWTLAWVV